MLPACAPAAPAPRLDWRPCGDGLECATATVPLDWSRPGGPTLELAVARYPAPGDPVGSLFFNPGGPGLSGVEALRARGTELAGLGGGRYDVVSWDPRGSTLSCSELMNGCAASDAAADVQALAHVTTTASARDLDHLRVLTGGAELNFLGESYGSFLGQVYANLFPDRVRAMVLDGVIDPVVNTSGAEERLANSMTDTSRVFAEFARRCTGAQRCALAGRSAGQVLRELLDRLSAAPMPTVAGTLTYADALIALQSHLGTPGRWPELARSLAEAIDGNGAGLVRRARQLRGELAATIPPATAITCVDSPARVSVATRPERLDQFAELDPIYGPLLTWWSWAPCASWPVGGADVYAGPWSATTRNPVLVIGATLDPV
ncbi:MAG: hypothetical protein K0R68_2291, partial [Mycobacterium sp.]|nr:hypothetical protein [Mycobacterium sp.]